MRALDRLSASSLTATLPTPWKGDPSRRMTGPSRGLALVLEVAGIDRLETRLVDREPSQRSLGANHGIGRVRPHVAIRRHAETIRPHRLDAGHAGYGREPSRQPCPVGLDFDHKARAENLAREIGHRAHQHDATGLKQGDAIAHPLYLIEHVRRQQYGDALGLELFDQAE